MSDQINDTLRERAKSYGDYNDKTRFVQLLKAQMRETPSWDEMHPGGREALDMIATKIGRLLYGDPQHDDSWLDIGGYAMLGKGGEPTASKATREFAHPNTCAHPNTWDTPRGELCVDCGELVG